MGISGYILSIVGVILIGVLTQSIMPDGTMSKYIQNIFALIIVFVIIAPIPSILGAKFDASKVLEVAKYDIDQNFVYLVNTQTVRQLEQNLKQQLEIEGYSNVDINIFAQIFESPLNLQKVTIDLKNVVIKANVQHINKYNNIRSILTKTLGIKEEQIVFYG